MNSGDLMFEWLPRMRIVIASILDLFDYIFVMLSYLGRTNMALSVQYLNLRSFYI